MAHELTQHADGKVEFVSGRNITAWHKLGTVVEGLMTATECIEKANLNWDVEQVPVLMSGEGEDLLEISGYYAVRRKDNMEPLSIMSARYTPINNGDAFNFFDKVIGEGKASWETAGSIAGGRKVFMQATLPGNLFLRSNPDDVTEKRILFLTSHDGSTALTGLITPIRVVCQNTLNAALRNCSNVFKVFHRKNYEAKVSEAAKVLEFSTAYFDNLQFVMDALADKKVDGKYVTSFLEKIVPSTKEDDEESTRTKNRRQAITNLFTDGTGNKGDTRWDLFNAVTEFVDHHQHGRVTMSRLEKATPDANIKEEQRFERSLFGAGSVMKQKAMDILMAN